MRRKMRIPNLMVLACAAGLGFPGCSDDGTKPKQTDPLIVEVGVSVDSVDGQLRIELYPEQAPLTVENFLRYVDDGFYEGTIFHRVIRNFMIQGGGFTEGMVRVPPTYPPVPLESRSGLLNVRGTIAAARARDPNSATSQFFINQKDNPSLDYPKPDGHGYAVFGTVIEGMDVVDSIASVDTDTLMQYHNVPTKPIVIREIRRAPVPQSSRGALR